MESNPRPLHMEPTAATKLYLLQNERRDIKFRDSATKNCMKIFNVGRRITQGAIHVAQSGRQSQ